MKQEYEFETPVHGYNATPFLVEYSLNRAEGIDIIITTIEQVSYDSLVLSITDLPLPVAEHINGAIKSNMEYNKIEATKLYHTMASLAAERPNLYGTGLLTLLDNWEDVTEEKIRRSIHDMKKNIKEAPINMRETLGDEAFEYFRDAEFIF